MASQRHKLVEYGSTAAGEIHAEGEVARSVIHQVIPDPSVLNVLKAAPKEGEIELVVPTGPPGGPLQGSSMSGAIPEDLPTPPPGPNPEPGEEPTVTSIDPNTAVIGGEDLTLTVTGTFFNAETFITFNNSREETTFVSDTELTTIVKPSTASTPGSYPVAVEQGNYTSTSVDFTFTEEVEEEGGGTERILPAGPFTISRIDDDPDGIQLTIDGSPDIRLGDQLLVEATGNTSINGTYEVIGLDPIVVDNPYELTAPIEAKGRVTIS